MVEGVAPRSPLAWSALRGGTPSAGAGGAGADGQGAALWDFLVTFVAARRMFLSIYRRYEERVLRAARASGVAREELVLPPARLFGLFHLRRLTYLRDVRLRPLADLAERIFAEHEDEELLDLHCSHIFHEISILAEEHRSVGRFVRIRDRRRYEQLFEEVSGYYPMRLRRVRRLFEGALKRIEQLLPAWAAHREVVRGVYLFGERVALHAYGEGVPAIYARMYPDGGEVQGYLEAAKSFRASEFVIRAREAAVLAQEAAARLPVRRQKRAARRAAEEAARLVAELDAEAGVRPAP